MTIDRGLFFLFLLLSLLQLPAPGSAVTLQEHVNGLVHQADQYSKDDKKKFIAIAYINEAIKLQPRNLQLYYKRAFILGRAGLYNEAINEFTRFVRHKEFPHAVRFRADCFMAIHDMPRAVRDYRAFLAREAKDGKVWSYLVEAYALMGDTHNALKAVNQGLATGSHWSGRLQSLQAQIVSGQRIKPHKPLSN